MLRDACKAEQETQITDVDTAGFVSFNSFQFYL